MARSNAYSLMERKRAFSQMVQSRESKRTVSKPLNMRAVKKTSCTPTAPESENIRTAGSRRLTQMAQLRPLRKKLN